MGTVRLEGIGNFSAMAREYDKVEAKNRQLRGSLQMNAAESKKAALTAKKDLGAWKQGVVSLHGENARLQQKIKQGIAVSGQAARKQIALAQAAKQVYLQTRTPQEQYNARIKRLDALLAKTTMTQRTYNRAVAQAKEQLQAAGGAGKKGFGPAMVSRLAAVAGGYMSIQGAIRSVIAAVKDKQEQDRKALAANINLAGPQAGASLMLPDMTAEQAAQFRERVNALAAEVKPVGGKQALYQFLAGTLSAGGSEERAFKAAKIGSQLGRTSAEEASAISTGVLDVATATGDEDMQRNAGLLLAATQQARVVGVGPMGKFGARAAQAIKQQGDGISNAFALYAALTKGMMDETGQQASTAAIRFAVNLAQAFPEEDITKVSKKGVASVKTKGTGLASTKERLEYLWKHPEEAEQFVQSKVAKGRAGAIGALTNLVMGPSAAPLKIDYSKSPQEIEKAQAATGMMGNYLTAMANIPKLADAAAYTERKLAVIESAPAQQLAAAERTQKSTVGRLLTETEAGKAAAKRGIYSADNLDTALAASGVGYWSRKAEVAGFYLSKETNKGAYEESVRDRMFELRYPGVPYSGNVRASLFANQPALMRARRTKDPERLLRARILEEGLGALGVDLPGAPAARGGGAFEDVDSSFSLISSTVDSGGGGAKDISAPALESQTAETNRLLGVIAEFLAGPTQQANRPRNLVTHSE